MFCLRSWIPILFFLTHASPVYLVLFISATYFLNRPCVYCSLLLFILVVALFDFQTPWFEPPLPNDTETSGNGTTWTGEGKLETVAVFAQAAGNTAQTVLKGAYEGVRERVGAGVGEVSGNGWEWAKGLLGKKEWRIGCLDVLVRI